MTKFSELFGGSGQKNEKYETHSCCGGNGPGHQQDTNSQSHPKAVYQCPMKCEGDKTYDAPGNCPVCNMHLALVTEVHDH